MPPASSFDVTSPIDFQEVDNAINQARKEVGQRYDFKGSKSEITPNALEKTLTLVSDDEFKMNALWEIVQTRLVRRGVPIKNFKGGESEAASGGTVRRVFTIQEGIPIEAAREIVKFLKDQKLKKVQAAIQGDQVRVSSRVEGRPAGSHPRPARARLRRRAAVRQLPLGYFFSFFFHSTPVAFSGSILRIAFDIRSVFLSIGSWTS